MALPNVGGGRQAGDGNSNEVVLGTQSTPATFSDTAALTAAQIASGIIVADKGSDAATTATLPTGAAMDAYFSNAHTDSCIDFSICNKNDSGSSSTVTLAAGTGFTIVGAVVVARLASARYRARKTAAATWVAYRYS